MKLLILFLLLSLSFNLTFSQSYGFTPYYGLGINPFTSPLYGYGLSLGSYGGYGGYGGYYGRYPYSLGYGYGGYGYNPYFTRSDSQNVKPNS